MTDHVRLPFAQRLDSGAMVAIDTVIRGLACECICPACRARVVAVKGDVYRHHFRHHSDDTSCAGGRETALHLFAKQIICQCDRLVLPDEVRVGDVQSAAVEVWLDGIRPDVLLQCDEPVAVEICVTHPVPLVKELDYVGRPLTAVEINLRYYRDRDLNEAELRWAVLVDAPRRWLCPSLTLRQAAQAELAALKEQARLAAEERQRLAAEARRRMTAWEQEAAERRAALAEEAAKIAAARQAIVEERQRREDLARARIAREARERLGPNLQELVAAYGGYDKITLEAWIRHDDEVKKWKGSIWEF